MDDSTKKYMEIIFYTYIIRIICVIGVIGNSAILIVLSRKGAKGTAFVYIKALAGVDLLICIMLLGMGFIRCGDCISTPEQEFYGRVYEGFFYLPLANAGQMANLFITIAMAVHRAVSVLKLDGYALRIDVRKSRTVAKFLVMLIVGFSFVVNGIRFFFFTIRETCDTDARLGSTGKLSDPSVIPMSLVQSRPNVDSYYPNTPAYFNASYYFVSSVLTFNPQSSTTTQSPIQEDYKNKIYSENTTGLPKTYGTIDTGPNPVRYALEKTAFYDRVNKGFLLALSTLHFFELLTLTTVNIILIRVLRRSKSQRKSLIRTELRQRKKRDDDVTRMLVVTVVVHIVCHLHSPFSADPIAQLVFGQDYIKSNEYNIQLAVNNTLTLTSHAITFFLYLVCAKFRKQVKRTWYWILGRCGIGRWRSSRSSTPPSTGWTPSYTKGGASPILHRNPSLAVSARYL